MSTSTRVHYRSEHRGGEHQSDGFHSRNTPLSQFWCGWRLHRCHDLLGPGGQQLNDWLDSFYLLKPFDRDRFRAAFDRARRRVTSAGSASGANAWPSPAGFCGSTRAESSSIRADG
jgi:hypothetical protein